MTMTASTSAPIRILLIGEHTIIRAGLRLLIESQSNLTVVGDVDNRSDSIAIAEREQPQVILLDLDMGSENGLDYIPELLAAANQARVLVLTGLTGPKVHRRAMLLGATGIVLKTKASDVLIKAIEKVHIGEAWVDRLTMADILNEYWSQENGKDADPEAAKIALLTEREHEVIGLVAKGLKNKQIANRLNISESTVRHHLASIFSKLKVTSRLCVLKYAYQQGLVDLLN
jgi:DNA-binding NarL/FixJ family response regulator